MASSTSTFLHEYGVNVSSHCLSHAHWFFRYLRKRPWLFIFSGALLLLIDDYLILRGLGDDGFSFFTDVSDPVIGSAYGKIFGVPLGLLGLLTHLALLWALMKQMKSLVVILAGLIVLAAVFLVIIQAVVLNEWCAWCNTAHALGMVLAIGCSENLFNRPQPWIRKRFMHGISVILTGEIPLNSGVQCRGHSIADNQRPGRASKSLEGGATLRA